MRDDAAQTTHGGSRYGLYRRRFTLDHQTTNHCYDISLAFQGKVSRTLSQQHSGNVLLADYFFLPLVRFSLKDLKKDYEKTEDDIKAVQSVGQIIGEVMKQLDDERCEYHTQAVSPGFSSNRVY